MVKIGLMKKMLKIYVYSIKNHEFKFLNGLLDR